MIIFLFDYMLIMISTMIIKIIKQRYYREDNIYTMDNFTPTKVENLKLKEKSLTITNITHASQRSYKQKATKMVKYLNLDYFKLHPCNITKTHPHKHCMYYHNSKDKKRYGNFYSDIMCEFILQGDRCSRGEQCPKSHSRVEQLYQYDTYKKKFCTHYPNHIEECEYGDFCSFAHTEQEIRTNLIHNYEFNEDFYMFHYKTEFCPFNLTQHQKELCVYAHNLQDYRRNPETYAYQPRPCENWKLKDYITEYDNGCEIGLNCPMCHGWKELQYHPNYYRTNKCLESKCKKGECPNYHSQKEKRVVQDDILNHCFRYVSNNRITEGVFKPECQGGFQPRIDRQQKENGKSKSMVGRTMQGISSQFTPKTEINNKKNYRQKSPMQEEEEKPSTRFFFDESPVESDPEGSEDSEDSQVLNQVDKLMLGE